MDGTIRAPVVGHGHGPSGVVVTATGAAVGLIVGVALALSVKALTDTDPIEIGPFSAPTETCRFNTFNPPDLVPVSAQQPVVPAMVSRCNFIFKDRQYIQVGFRI